MLASPHEALFRSFLTEIGKHRSFVAKASQNALYFDTGVIHLVSVYHKAENMIKYRHKYYKKQK